jgi:hypothetical protein
VNAAIGLTDFLALFVPADADGFVELRAKKQPGPREFVRLSQPDVADRLFAYIVACERDENHPYFGVAERATDANGRKENLSWFRALYADCDFKDSSEPETRQRLADFPLQPSVLVESGGGLYPFWLLNEPVDLRAEGAIARTESVIRRLVATLHADTNATDVSRVLRLPGTQNRKYDPPREVRITAFYPERRYSLEQFEGPAALVPDPKAAARSAPRPETYNIGVVNPEKIISVLSRLWPDNGSGQRHQFAKHIGGWFAHRHVNENDAVEIVRATAEAANDDDIDDRVRVARDSYTNMAEGRNITGLASAIEIVPEMREVVDMLKEALGVVPRPLITADSNDEPEVPTVEQLVLPASGRIGLAREWADLYAEAYEAPWENFYFSFLTHLGARVAKHLRLDDDLGTEPRMYTIVLGASGIGKSEPINKAEADFAWADLGHNPDPLKPDPLRFEVVHGVGSGEALGEALEASQKRQVIFQPDEFSHVTNKSKIDGGSLIQILLALFERATFDNRTKGKAYHLEGASLTMLSACVDSVFTTIFDPKGGADTGIINRFWIVAGPQSLVPKANPRVDRVALDDIRRRLHRTLHPFQTMTVYQHLPVRLTPEAERCYRQWYDTEYFPIASKDIHMVRLRTYAKRLIMLGALTTSTGPYIPSLPIEAGVEVVEATLSMVRWQHRVRQQFTPIVSETRAGKTEIVILRAYRDIGEQGMTKREAQRRTSATKTGGVADWNRSFEALVSNGNLVPLEPLPAKPEKGGRRAGVSYRLAFM